MVKIENKFGLRASIKSLFYGFFSYTSLRQAKIDSLAVAVVYRVVQIAILTYIIGWELVLKKGYQSFDAVSSAVTTKVKGFGYVPRVDLASIDLNRHFDNNKIDVLNYRIFDTADYIIPPNEYNSFFVLTNFVQTDQSPGVCDEDYTKVINSICKSDNDCANISPNTWNGIPTGRCISSSRNATVKVCEINAWCPVEDDSPTDVNLIKNVLNFTVFIKNDVEFKSFGKRERNILPNITNDYISRCTYDAILDPYCPVFRLGKILDDADINEQEQQGMLRKGGVVQIEISWNCNYDLYSSKCQPKYSFYRFDLPFRQSSTASGFNFRYADKYKVNDQYYRTLVKAYGLRFIINVTGQGGKFSILPLFLTVGAGLGLLSISAMIADCYMSNFSEKRKLYKQMTVLELKEEDEELLKSSLNSISEKI